jgi:hypothetical protein
MALRIAQIVDDDDPHERQRILDRGKPARRLCRSTSAAMATEMLTVRIDLNPMTGDSRSEPNADRDEDKG